MTGILLTDRNLLFHSGSDDRRPEAFGQENVPIKRRWNEDKEAGLGGYFLVHLQSLFGHREPKSIRWIHGKAYLGLHRALSKRFPFAIYYTIDGELLRVRAVADCRKNPLWIRQHLEGA